MTKTEHLINKLSEECVETSQRCSKALRFGMEEIQPGQDQTNSQRIRLEFAGALAAYQELMEKGLLVWPTDTEIAEARAKARQYLIYAEQKCGTVNHG
jgi:hypothetical protein